MRAVAVATIRRLAPYGVRDLFVQIGLWVVFGLAYEAVRGAVNHDRARAFANGRTIIDLERHLHAFFEATLQRDVLTGSVPYRVIDASYWISEFVLLVLALVYVYFRHREVYGRFRDAVLIANSLGLIGYLVFPTAPPRLFAGDGFRNAVSGQPLPVHATGLIGFAANPYAAMPSLHIADAILIGVFLAGVSSSRLARIAWLLWPWWLSFVVIVTGNHFWLDVVAGAVVAALALVAVSLIRLQRSPTPGVDPSAG